MTYVPVDFYDENRIVHTLYLKNDLPTPLQLLERAAEVIETVPDPVKFDRISLLIGNVQYDLDQKTGISTVKKV